MLAAACGLALVALLETAFGDREGSSADEAARRATASADSELYTVPDRLRSLEALARRLGDMTSATVTRIVDGDTLVVELPGGSQEKVRLIGVDTPESVDPRKPVERFSKEAAAYAERRLLGRDVRLAFGPEGRDYYGRLLAYVFLDDGTCVNLAIVSDGYGFAYLKYPFPFQDEFSTAEREARRGGRGLWATSGETE